MPFYEYRCTKGHTFEVRQSMSDEPLKKCEVCGAKASRVLFAPAIHFKGTGFHNTDYGTKKRPKEGPSGDGAPTKPDGAAAPAASTTANPSSTAEKPKTAKQATPADRSRRGVGP